MSHRFGMSALHVMGAAWLGVALSTLSPSPVAGQPLFVSPRVSAMDGDGFAASAALRGELGSSRLAVYFQGGLFGTTNICTASDPPCCSSPSDGGVELLGGLQLSLPRSGAVHPAISLGAGGLFWRDFWGYNSGVGNIWEAEFRLGVKAFSWSDLVLGATLKNIGQSVSGGMKLGRDRRTHVGIVVGLLIPVGGQ